MRSSPDSTPVCSSDSGLLGQHLPLRMEPGPHDLGSILIKGAVRMLASRPW